jgi:hypothetical protein
MNDATHPSADAQAPSPTKLTDDGPIRALSDNPAVTAAAILSGNFARSGIGTAGSAYRHLASIDDASEPVRTETWSTFFAALSDLWDAGQKEACLIVLEISASHFSVPVDFSDKIDAYIEDAKIEIALEKIEDRFAEGDDEGALSYIRKLPEKHQNEYRKYIHQRASTRAKTRKLTFALAGSFGIILAGFAVYGTYGVVQMLKNPPKFELPEFTTSPVFEKFEAFETERTILPKAESSPVDNGYAQGGEPEGEWRDTDTVSNSAAMSPSTASSDNGSDEIAKTATPEMLYNCALGTAGAAKAAVLLERSDSPEQAAKLAVFKDKLDAACATAGISAEQIDPLIQNLDPEIIHQISLGILSN